MFSLFKRFKEGLKRTANGALGKLAGLFSKKIDPSDIALIEETLIEADFGYETVCEIIDAIKSEYPEIPAYETYDELYDAIRKVIEG